MGHWLLQWNRFLCWQLKIPVNSNLFRISTEIDHSNWLSRNDLKEISNLKCARKIGQNHGITDFQSQLCASNSVSGNSLCTGSTGSFVGLIENNVQVVYGVTSFVVPSKQDKTCYREAITVFSRVASYIDWIENIVWP